MCWSSLQSSNGQALEPAFHFALRSDIVIPRGLDQERRQHNSPTGRNEALTDLEDLQVKVTRHVCQCTVSPEALTIL